jgi:hypothetical protein
MIDIGELQRQGKIRPMNNNVDVPTDKDGFIELGEKEANVPNVQEKTAQSAPTFDFFNVSKTEQTTTFSEETNGYSKREVDAKMQELDNKMYKMEQRVELLERKAGVNQPMGSGPVIGW